MIGWLLNPWMLLGGLAIASPILIHLLNKRRFKIVEWAAMDFLFEADKKNRRRVQLENLILLMMRCLAMLLIALLLGRPFLPTGVSKVFQQAEKFERVVLIDDSLSQRVLTGTRPAIEVARESLIEMMSRFANTDESEDWLTVMLTSRPDQPLFANEPLTENSLAALIQTVESLESSDRVADYTASLNELKRYVSGQRESVSRVVYLYTDLREQDWVNQEQKDSQFAPNQLINNLAADTLGSFVIDVGSPEDNNLAIIDVRPDGLLVADKLIRFQALVANHGTQTVSDLRVLFQVDEGQPSYEVIPSIAPGETQAVAFRHVFLGQHDELGLLDDESSDQALFQNYQVRIEIDRQSLGESGLLNDQLLEDSSAIFAARVLDGLSVLLVDGDPSSVSERSETHYLNSLAVLGSGLKMETATVSELETASLSKYQVIFLCNVDEASHDRIRSLEQWVDDGGSLVLMPGNRVRAQTFNEAFYRRGAGLSPMALGQIAGDPTMTQWVHFEIDPQNHPAIQTVIDSGITSFFSDVEIFSWWTSNLSPEKIGKSVSVPLRLSDRENSPAMVDRSWGDGQVVVFTIPGDGDWTMWPSSDTFVLVMNDLINYLVGSETERTGIEIGGEISSPVDLTVYENRVRLRDPENEKVEAVARPIGEAGSEETSVLYQVNFKDIDQVGFYKLELKRHSGETDQVLFASNVDTTESRLKRLTDSILKSDFFGDRVTLISTEELEKQTVSGGNTEIWWQLLVALFGLLLAEQFLAWHWGRKR